MYTGLNCVGARSRPIDLIDQMGRMALALDRDEGNAKWLALATMAAPSKSF